MNDQEFGRNVFVANGVGRERPEPMGEFGLLVHRHRLIPDDDDAAFRCQLLQRLHLVVMQIEQHSIRELGTELR